MLTITVEGVIHRDEPRLLLKFQKDQTLMGLVRSIPYCQWSKTLGAWHVPNNPASKADLVKLTTKDITIDWGNKPSQSAMVITQQGISSIQTADSLTLFRQYMEQRRYSANTIHHYAEGLKVFLGFINKSIPDITNADLERFNLNYVIKHGYSSSFQNQVINAVKLFFRSIRSVKFSIEKVERPRCEHRLPNVLSKEEVKRIITSPTNTKHRAMLSLIYACGLRRSELLNLKPEHVDSKRGLLIIKQAKGNKDRVVPISDKIIEMLREYYKMYKPKVWLFEGQQEGEQYSAESIQKVLKDATIKAKVNKPVTLHWLRHSYATHLLESGTDLRYIQEILGHKSSKTTEIYTHVSTQSIQKIKSPFDDL